MLGRRWWWHVANCPINWWWACCWVHSDSERKRAIRTWDSLERFPDWLRRQCRSFERCFYQRRNEPHFPVPRGEWRRGTSKVEEEMRWWEIRKKMKSVQDNVPQRRDAALDWHRKTWFPMDSRGKTCIDIVRRSNKMSQWKSNCPRGEWRGYPDHRESPSWRRSHSRRRRARVDEEQLLRGANKKKTLQIISRWVNSDHRIWRKKRSWCCCWSRNTAFSPLDTLDRKKEVTVTGGDEEEVAAAAQSLLSQCNVHSRRLLQDGERRERKKLMQLHTLPVQSGLHFASVASFLGPNFSTCFPAAFSPLFIYSLCIHSACPTEGKTVKEEITAFSLQQEKEREREAVTVLQLLWLEQCR